MFWTIGKHGKFMFISQLVASSYGPLHVYSSWLHPRIQSVLRYGNFFFFSSNLQHTLGVWFVSLRPFSLKILLGLFWSAQTNCTKKVKVKVVQASDPDASQGFLGRCFGHVLLGAWKMLQRLYLSAYSRKCLGISPRELEEVVGKREVWASPPPIHRPR